MSHHAESRGHVATKLCLRYTRVERYRLMMIFKEGEKENRRYSNRDVRKGSWIDRLGWLLGLIWLAVALNFAYANLTKFYL